MSDEQKSILVVEDDIVLRQMLTKMLTAKGFLVYEAKNGVEGLMYVDEKKPDLMILDFDMPQMDGINMLRTMKKGGNVLPILMLTNMNKPGLIADAAEFGVEEFLVKSDWEIDAIVLKVEEKLYHKHSS